MIALREQSRGVLSSFMFLLGRLPMPQTRRGDREHATLLFRARECRFDSAERGWKFEAGGDRDLNDTSSGDVQLATCEMGRLPFFKNLHFPRHIFSARWKYTAEDMEDSVYEKYGINPNRTPTEAEVGLVAYCFNVSETEAITILSNRANHFLSKVSPLDLREDSKPKVKGQNK